MICGGPQDGKPRGRDEDVNPDSGYGAKYESAEASATRMPPNTRYENKDKKQQNAML
jgi:hypothetical protein